MASAIPREQSPLIVRNNDLQVVISGNVRANLQINSRLRLGRVSLAESHHSPLETRAVEIYLWSMIQTLPLHHGLLITIIRILYMRETVDEQRVAKFPVFASCHGNIINNKESTHSPCAISDRDNGGGLSHTGTHHARGPFITHTSSGQSESAEIGMDHPRQGKVPSYLPNQNY